MMPSLRSFDDLDGKERGQKKTDDLRAMTTLGPRTLNTLACKEFLLSRHDEIIFDSGRRVCIHKLDKFIVEHPKFVNIPSS